jgi:isocitrate/isopropylmalate dehydrogenase
MSTFWTATMMLDHLGEKPAADRLMRAIEKVTADPSLHTPRRHRRHAQCHRRRCWRDPRRKCVGFS